VSCAPDSAGDVLAMFKRHGFAAAAVVGEITASGAGRVSVV
jgi:selenide, water dikinase